MVYHLVEQFWLDILSRESGRILGVWCKLNPDEQTALVAHLRKMVTEEGWTEPQCISAKAALKAIGLPGNEHKIQEI